MINPPGMLMIAVCVVPSAISSATVHFPAFLNVNGWTPVPDNASNTVAAPLPGGGVNVNVDDDVAPPSHPSPE